MTRRRSLSTLSSGLIVLVATLGLTSAASAATTLAGGNVGGQTWTGAGSPYLINGDITVQSGTTLTIQAGVQIQFAGTDGQHTGLDPSRVELTVNGRLVVNGTFNSSVTSAVRTAPLKPGTASSSARVPSARR